MPSFPAATNSFILRAKELLGKVMAADNGNEETASAPQDPVEATSSKVQSIPDFSTGPTDKSAPPSLHEPLSWVSPDKPLPRLPISASSFLLAPEDGDSPTTAINPSLSTYTVEPKDFDDVYKEPEPCLRDKQLEEVEGIVRAQQTRTSSEPVVKNAAPQDELGAKNQCVVDFYTNVVPKAPTTELRREERVVGSTIVGSPSNQTSGINLLHGYTVAEELTCVESVDAQKMESSELNKLVGAQLESEVLQLSSKLHDELKAPEDVEASTVSDSRLEMSKRDGNSAGSTRQVPHTVTEPQSLRARCDASVPLGSTESELVHAEGSSHPYQLIFAGYSVVADPERIQRRKSGETKAVTPASPKTNFVQHCAHEEVRSTAVTTESPDFILHPEVGFAVDPVEQNPLISALDIDLPPMAHPRHNFFACSPSDGCSLQAKLHDRRKDSLGRFEESAATVSGTRNPAGPPPVVDIIGKGQRSDEDTKLEHADEIYISWSALAASHSPALDVPNTFTRFTVPDRLGCSEVVRAAGTDHLNFDLDVRFKERMELIGPGHVQATATILNESRSTITNPCTRSEISTSSLISGGQQAVNRIGIPSSDCLCLPDSDMLCKELASRDTSVFPNTKSQGDVLATIKTTVLEPDPTADSVFRTSTDEIASGLNSIEQIVPTSLDFPSLHKLSSMTRDMPVARYHDRVESGGGSHAEIHPEMFATTTLSEIIEGRSRWNPQKPMSELGTLAAAPHHVPAMSARGETVLASGSVLSPSLTIACTPPTRTSVPPRQLDIVECGSGSMTNLIFPGAFRLDNRMGIAEFGMSSVEPPTIKGDTLSRLSCVHSFHSQSPSILSLPFCFQYSTAPAPASAPGQLATAEDGLPTENMLALESWRVSEYPDARDDGHDKSPGVAIEPIYGRVLLPQVRVPAMTRYLQQPRGHTLDVTETALSSSCALSWDVADLASNLNAACVELPPLPSLDCQPLLSSPETSALPLCPIPILGNSDSTSNFSARTGTINIGTGIRKRLAPSEMEFAMGAQSSCLELGGRMGSLKQLELNYVVPPGAVPVPLGGNIAMSSIPQLPLEDTLNSKNEVESESHRPLSTQLPLSSDSIADPNANDEFLLDIIALGCLDSWVPKTGEVPAAQVPEEVRNCPEALYENNIDHISQSLRLALRRADDAERTARAAVEAAKWAIAKWEEERKGRTGDLMHIVYSGVVGTPVGDSKVNEAPLPIQLLSTESSRQASKSDDRPRIGSTTGQSPLLDTNVNGSASSLFERQGSFFEGDEEQMLTTARNSWNKTSMTSQQVVQPSHGIVVAQSPKPGHTSTLTRRVSLLPRTPTSTLPRRLTVLPDEISAQHASVFPAEVRRQTVAAIARRPSSRISVRKSFMASSITHQESFGVTVLDDELGGDLIGAPLSPQVSVVVDEEEDSSDSSSASDSECPSKPPSPESGGSSEDSDSELVADLKARSIVREAPSHTPAAAGRLRSMSVMTSRSPVRQDSFKMKNTLEQLKEQSPKTTRARSASASFQRKQSSFTGTSFEPISEFRWVSGGRESSSANESDVGIVQNATKPMLQRNQRETAVNHGDGGFTSDGAYYRTDLPERLRASDLNREKDLAEYAQQVVALTERTVVEMARRRKAEQKLRELERVVYAMKLEAR
ncbi:hypothetical protein HDU93_003998 [Gonapodya sp. JEL0774]|nr:hypothetical protein HDU93_003998 [Gonapodya sp. JEL0774]